MTPADLRALPPEEAAALPTLLHALWLDAHGDWTAAHSLVDELETPDGCWVHAYLLPPPRIVKGTASAVP